MTRLLEAVTRIATGRPRPVPYRQDPRTGDYHPGGDVPVSFRTPAASGFLLAPASESRAA